MILSRPVHQWRGSSHEFIKFKKTAVHYVSKAKFEKFSNKTSYEKAMNKHINCCS